MKIIFSDQHWVSIQYNQEHTIKQIRYKVKTNTQNMSLQPQKLLLHLLAVSETTLSLLPFTSARKGAELLLSARSLSIFILQWSPHVLKSITIALVAILLELLPLLPFWSILFKIPSSLVNSLAYIPTTSSTFTTLAIHDTLCTSDVLYFQELQSWNSFPTAHPNSYSPFTITERQTTPPRISPSH